MLPAFVLLDLQMPRMSGLEALRLIRRTPGLEHLPVLILTFSPDDIDLSVATALRATDFIVRSGSIEQLRETLRGLLARFGVTEGKSKAPE